MASAREPDLGLFVVGMHRSGTSAVTRIVNLIGVPLGAEDGLKQGSPVNPTGFWEVAALTTFNERLLVELGGTWHAPPHLPPSWTQDERLSPQREGARRTFHRFHHTRQWLWKDPRNAIVLPFWLDVLDVRPVAVLVWRHPLEVAQSLASRNNFSRRLSLALWERYMRQALMGIRGLPTLVAPYADILDAPEPWMELARDFLLSQGVDCDGVANEAEARRFLDPKLRHAVITANDVGDSTFSDAQRELLRTLEGLDPTYERFTLPPLPPETPWTEPLLEERRFTENARLQERKRLREAKRARHRALSDLQKPIARIGQDLAGVRDAIAPIKRIQRDAGRAGDLVARMLAAEDRGGSDRRTRER